MNKGTLICNMICIVISIICVIIVENTFSRGFNIFVILINLYAVISNVRKLKINK